MKTIKSFAGFIFVITVMFVTIIPLLILLVITGNDYSAAVARFFKFHEIINPKP